MDGNLRTKKIKSWLLKSVLKLNETGDTQDIHVDELLKNFDIYCKEDAFMQSCLLFKYIVDYLEASKIKTSGIGIFLSIELSSESDLFSGKPASLAEVERLVDTYSIPEIIFYRDLSPLKVPLTELYRVPILIDYFNRSTPISIFYKEYRTYEEILNNGEFSRTIEAYYMQSP